MLPVLYSVEIFKNLGATKNILEQRGMWDPRMNGLLERAYRDFASLIRDYDAYEKIIDIIKIKKESIDFNISVEQNPSLDSWDYTDILILCKDDWKE
ncbi:MAG: hypothetical protein GF311_01300 [Candidatus Lokiarchaeota archaeon]|nr:hypothetical protein [Candidatus Lokiarchaeota archaeon]